MECRSVGKIEPRTVNVNSSENTNSGSGKKIKCVSLGAGGCLAARTYVQNRKHMINSDCKTCQKHTLCVNERASSLSLPFMIIIVHYLFIRKQQTTPTHPSVPVLRSRFRERHRRSHALAFSHFDDDFFIGLPNTRRVLFVLICIRFGVPMARRCFDPPSECLADRKILIFFFPLRAAFARSVRGREERGYKAHIVDRSLSIQLFRSYHSQRARARAPHFPFEKMQTLETDASFMSIDFIQNSQFSVDSLSFIHSIVLCVLVFYALSAAASFA